MGGDYGLRELVLRLNSLFSLHVDALCEHQDLNSGGQFPKCVFSPTYHIHIFAYKAEISSGAVNLKVIGLDWTIASYIMPALIIKDLVNRDLVFVL